jgi:hypothetical protein
MIKLKILLLENLFGDLERFREPLRTYMQKTFPKEYDSKQLLMFGLSMNDLIDVFLNKILSIRIRYTYYSEDTLPYGEYNFKDDTITIGGVYHGRYNSSSKYAAYVDSVIYHELVHAINYHKKLFNKITYDALMMGDKYYGDPEEIRAYTSELKDFLIGHLGFSRKQAEDMMNRYSSDRSETRKKWIAKYHDLKESKEERRWGLGLIGKYGEVVYKWLPSSRYHGVEHSGEPEFSHNWSNVRFRFHFSEEGKKTGMVYWDVGMLTEDDMNTVENFFKKQGITITQRDSKLNLLRESYK